MTKTASPKEIFTKIRDLVQQSTMSKEASEVAGTTETAVTENNDINKEAASVAGNNGAASQPGKDTNFQSVDGKHENHDKNSIGADKHAPQNHEQHKQNDPSTPVKAASDVEKLGTELMQFLEKFAKGGSAPTATGVPGKDTNFQSVSSEHDKENKNNVGADKLAPQHHEQHKQTDPSTPVKSAEEQQKIASEALGRALVQTILKQAADSELQLLKEAGRRDFEMLVATAAEGLAGKSSKQVKTASVNIEKQAEEDGAAYFQQLKKQAEFEQFIQEVRGLEAKHAEAIKEVETLRNKVAEAEQAKAKLEKMAAQEEENRKLVAMAELISNSVTDRVTDSVMARLRSEISGSR